MSERAKIIDRLRKLIAAEEGERQLNNFAAAEAFALKIADLLEKHRIEVAELTPEEIGKEVGRTTWRPEDSGLAFKRSPAWLRKIAVAVSEGNHCVSIYFSGTCRQDFLGLRVDAEVSRALFGILVLSGLASWERERARLNGNLHKASYMQGFAEGLLYRYAEHEARLDEDANRQALVRKTDLAVMAELERQEVKKGRGLQPPKNIDAATVLGWDAAQRVSLDRNQIHAGQPVPALPAGA